MNKKLIVYLIILLVTYLVFRPKYPGYGQKCECLGYKQDKVDKSHLSLADPPNTFMPLIKGTEITTTICYGIPYQCKLNMGYDILYPTKN